MVGDWCSRRAILVASAVTAAACIVALTLGSDAGSWPGLIGRATGDTTTAGRAAAGADSRGTPLLVVGTPPAMGGLAGRCRCSAARICGIAASAAKTISASSTAYRLRPTPCSASRGRFRLNIVLLKQRRGGLRLAAYLVTLAGQPAVAVHRHEGVGLDGERDGDRQECDEREDPDVAGPVAQVRDAAQ